MNANQYAIRHRIEVEASPAELYRAVATREGIAAWWTPRVTGRDAEGETLSVRFGSGDVGPDMRIECLREHERVQWRCVKGPWPGMRLRFDVAEHERGSVLVFEHGGWSEPSDFFMHCNSKWGYFLVVSLKSYLETGVGHPHPEDPAI
ncbi:MAG: SRPBCC domain-containing protein [Myxococcales bacterium]|nr:SRPBCC domain-containing protein [Myxococcales bacterium]